MSTATATLSRSTDTPKAPKAPATKAPSTAVTVTKGKATATAPEPTKAKVASVDSAKFVTLVKGEAKNVAGKARIVGKAIDGGSTPTLIASALTVALEANDLIVPKSFSASITHYATAYACAKIVKLTDHDAALHAVYQISTGALGKGGADKRNEFVNNFSGSPEAFISGCRDLLKATKPPKGSPPAGDKDAEDAEAPEEISPVAEFKALMKQAAKMLELAAENDDSTDYDEMLADAFDFAAVYVGEISSRDF